MVASPLAALWTDECDIWVRQGRVDSETGQTVFQEAALYTGLPCRVSYRLSFETVSGVRDTNGMAAAAGQAVKLFLAPEIQVPAGCKIVVRGRGRESVYGRSGVPAVYDSHQEVRLERFDRWA